jgi:hypothetical protein
MAFLGPDGFDANDHPPLNLYDPIPAGRYLAAIADSTVKTTKAGDGRYLELRFQILEGPHRGRSLFTRLNLWHPSPSAVAMACAELSSICRAAGVMKPCDSLGLHDIPVLIGVRLKRREDTQELVNEVRGFWPRESFVPAEAATLPWDGS